MNVSIFYGCLVTIFGCDNLNNLCCWKRLIRLSWLLKLLWKFLNKNRRGQPRGWLGLHYVDLKVNLRQDLLYLNWWWRFSGRSCDLLLITYSVLKNWPLVFLILLVHSLLGGCFVLNSGHYCFNKRLRVSLILYLIDFCLWKFLSGHIQKSTEVKLLRNSIL